CDVLGCESVSDHDDFFDMGGHSLKAITLASEIEHIFKVDIPLSDMFNHSVFRGMADYIQSNMMVEPMPDTVIVPVTEKEYHEVSSAQKRMYIIHEMMDDGLSYNLAA